MIYLRNEGGTIRNGFNFYPWGSSHAGFQFKLGKLRGEFRYSRKTGRLHVGAWWHRPVDLSKPEIIYIPGYTEYLIELYEGYKGGKYSEWNHDEAVEAELERAAAERRRIREELRKAAQ